MRPPRIVRWLARAVIAVLALIGVYVVLATVWLHGPVDERSLLRSVSDAAGSAGGFEPSAPCRRPAEPGGTWECGVMDREGSGVRTYRVTVRDSSSCWDAELMRDDLTPDAPANGLPSALSGCVRVLEWPVLL
jgi:hypothetical protein